MYKNLLQIYDADDWLMRSTGALRGADETIGVSGGIKGLIKALDKLVSEGNVFGHAVFHTHGNEGLIAFNNDRITTQVLKEKFTDRKYERLFPIFSRIYFNGCKVTAGDAGWEFLETAGAIFLRNMGGQTFGHTDSGYPLAPYLLTGLLSYWKTRGHSPHQPGTTRYVTFGPGGAILEGRPQPGGIPPPTFPEKERVWKGTMQ